MVDSSINDSSARDRCPSCRADVSRTDRFCSSCGLALASDAANDHAGSPVRRRIGGTIWRPQAAEEIGGPSAPLTLPASVPAATGGRRRKRKKRRSSWRRRPIVVVPLALLLLALATGGYAGWRASSAFTALREVSTPPAQVGDQTQNGDDVLPSGFVVDTGPAEAAIKAAASGEASVLPAIAGGTPVAGVAFTAPKSASGGLLSKVTSAAKDATDLAAGAAVAAGVKDPGAEAMTILVMGVDARAGAPIDVGVRPDALMVVRLDPTTKSCRMLSIPRDTRVNLPGYGESKINHALMVGGIPYQELVVQNLLGISIDGYLLVDFDAFKLLVDAVGGVPVTVAAPVTVAGKDLKAGAQTMDGTTALAYARYRDPASDGDIGRVKRQWTLLRGIASVEHGRDLPGDLNALLPVVSTHMRTNLTASDLATIAKTYGGSCVSEEAPASVLAGTRVRLADPILQQTVDYNVIDSALVRKRVSELLGAAS